MSLERGWGEARRNDLCASGHPKHVHGSCAGPARGRARAKPGTNEPRQADAREQRESRQVDATGIKARECERATTGINPPRASRPAVHLWRCTFACGQLQKWGSRPASGRIGPPWDGQARLGLGFCLDGEEAGAGEEAVLLGLFCREALLGIQRQHPVRVRLRRRISSISSNIEISTEAAAQTVQ